MPRVNQTLRLMKVNIPRSLTCHWIVLIVLCLFRYLWSDQIRVTFAFPSRKKCRRWKCSQTRYILVIWRKIVHSFLLFLVLFIIWSRFFLVLLHLILRWRSNKRENYDCTMKISHKYSLLSHIVYKRDDWSWDISWDI